MAEPDATSELDSGDGARSQATQQQPAVAGSAPGRFLPYLQAAGLAFLALLALGALFLIALKLQFADIGAGADPVEVLTGLVILALAALRVPVHIGDVVVTVLPLGAMLAVAWIVRWSCRATVSAARPRHGLLVGLFFGSIASVAALVFRLRLEPDAIYAGAVGAFVLGTIWVSLWASLSFAAAQMKMTEAIRLHAVSLQRKRPLLFHGARTGLLMVAAACLLAAAAALVWAIVVLIRGGGPAYDHVGEVAAALVYLAAFAPNLVVGVVALSLGAPLQIGAGLTIGGRVRETVRQISVFDGGADAMLLLLLVPLIACTLGGYWAHSHAGDAKQAWRVLAIAAVVFASVLSLLAAVGDVRLGAQLTPERGFGLIAPRSGLVFVLGLLWAAGGGYAGWTAAGRRR